MCGHFGIFGQLNQRIINAFEDGLSLDQVRGVHSTGAAFIERKAVTVIKDVVLPHKLYRRADWSKAMAKPIVGIIGHNRAATAGAVSKDNAHPFQHGAITLAHNGTILQMDRHKLPDHTKFEVDSDNICYAINKFGIEKAWSCIDGAAVLVYHDANNNSLNIVSNMQRPFEFSWINGMNCIMWCSEVNFLKAALERNSIETSTKEDSFTLHRNRLFTFFLDKKGGLQYQTTDLEPFRGPVVPIRSTGSKYRHVGGEIIEVDQYGRRVEEDGRAGFNRWMEDSKKSGGAPDLYTDQFGLDQRGDAFPTSHTMGPVQQTKASTVVPFTGSGNVTRGGMTAASFHSNIRECVFCRGKVDFLTCAIIDDETAACKDCAAVADASHVPLARASDTRPTNSEELAKAISESVDTMCAC